MFQIKAPSGAFFMEVWARLSRADSARMRVVLQWACLQELIQQRKFVTQLVEFCFDSGSGQSLGTPLYMHQHHSSPSYVCAQAPILWADESNTGRQTVCLSSFLACTGRTCVQFFLASGERGPQDAAIDYFVYAQHLDGTDALWKCAFNQLKVSVHVACHLPRQ